MPRMIREIMDRTIRGYTVCSSTGTRLRPVPSVATENRGLAARWEIIWGWLGSTAGSPQTVQHWGLRSEDSAPTPATHRLDSFFNGLLELVKKQFPRFSFNP